MKKNDEDVYVCEKCGSDDVNEKYWVNPNTNQILDSAVLSPYDQWCENCDNNTNIITLADYKQNN